MAAMLNSVLQFCFKVGFLYVVIKEKLRYTSTKLQYDLLLTRLS